MVTIDVENLSKRYVLGAQRSNSIRDTIAGAFAGGRSRRDELWALRDVSFAVGEGETLGIIGHNGAGKSTLLKILSRITKPTSGRARLHGRVGSLLEVGTGFHNELTGRENIYMNGAILGMKRAEIAAKFDEIVAFSEVERFLDTPVKHYSSGMYMRLAFSVAAHLEPEILIVDEVLAVGDVNFQKKCLGKMNEVSRSGRTVLFVSHNIGSLSQICTTGLLLDKGGVAAFGPIQETIVKYLRMNQQETRYRATDDGRERDIRFTEAFVSDMRGTITNEIPHNEPFHIEFDVEVKKPRRSAMFCIALLNKTKERVFTEHKLVDEMAAGRDSFHLRFEVPGELIAPNSYSFLLQVFLPSGEILHELPDVCPFTILDMGTDMAAYHDYGTVQMRGAWEVR